MKDDKNIILIGMCGVGKSTVGILLAKALSRYFLDTDVYIQAIENKGLQEIIDKDGLEKFCQIEESHILCIDIKNAVIATGGSVIYSGRAMKHLADSGVVIHLDLDYNLIEERITNLDTRGVVMAKSQTLKSLYSERQPLYRKWANITINCGTMTHDEVVTSIIKTLDGRHGQKRSVAM
jgi:shikimate kinase